MDTKLALVSDEVAERERRECMTWISPLNFSATQNENLGRCEKGTGKWILESDEFKRWLSGDGSTMWCCGIRELGSFTLGLWRC